MSDEDEMGRTCITRGEMKHAQCTLVWKLEKRGYIGELTINIDIISDSTPEKKALKMGSD
jgi:hypothetical protein